MRKNLQRPKTKSHEKETQALVMASIDVTKRQNDELKQTNSSLLGGIKSHERKIVDLRKMETSIQREIELANKLNVNRDNEASIKRKEVSDLQSSIKLSESLLKKQEDIYNKKIKELEHNYNKNVCILESKIESKQDILDGLTPELTILQNQINVSENQKSLIHNDITQFTKDLDNIKQDIQKSITETKRLKKKNDEISTESVSILSKKTILEQDTDDINKKQVIESKVLANLNGEISRKRDNLDNIKREGLLLIQEKERLHKLKAKIVDLYEKAGIQIKI